MRRFLLYLIPTIIINCSNSNNKSINIDSLEEVGIYKVNPETGDPYTGKAAKTYENGELELEGHYIDGLKNGLWIGWHSNGQKAQEINYSSGKQDGLMMEWYLNGQKKMEGFL